VPYLVAIPTKSFRYPWTLLTGALIENNAVSLAVSGCVIYFVGRYLERAWGSNEYAKFVVFVAVVPNVAAFALYALWHAVTGYAPELYEKPLILKKPRGLRSACLSGKDSMLTVRR
jgi:membrane associated rhomboid family serine protease